ncbi:MAG: secretin N-terminal domain-containing protein [Verrucomicrobiota bacterium]
MKIWIQKTVAWSALCVFALMGKTVSTAIEVDDPDTIVESAKIRGIPLIDVLAQMESLTGRAVIRPTALPNPEIYFDIPENMTKQELVLALESVLSINGIGIAPMGEKFIKVVAIGNISKESPELVVGTLAERAPSSQVVSKIFRLEYLDSQTFQEQIQPFLNPGFSSIIPFENSNAVIVTDTVSNLQRIEYVVSEVDKPSRFNIEPKFYPLLYAEATEVAQQIQRMIDDARNRFGEGGSNGQNNRNTRNIGNNRAGGRPGPGGQNQDGPQGPTISEGVAGEAGGAQNALFGSSTAISSDERTNQVIVITEPSNHPFFDEMIAKFDVRADPATNIEVIRLKHAEAQVVQSILSELVSGETSAETSDRSAANNNSNTNANTNNNRTTNNNQARTGNANAVGQNRPTVTASATGEERETQFSNFMTIVSDERSNSLIVTGTKSDLISIRELVDEIDVLLPQVRIEVVIVDVNLSDDATRGSDVLSAIWDETVATNEASGSDAQVTLGDFNILGLGLGETIFRIQDGEIADLLLNGVFTRAKDSSDVKVISVPTIVTTHNQEATISVGQSQPYISSTDTLVGGTSRSNVSFVDANVELTVTPLIGPNDVIQLTVDQTIDEITSVDETLGPTVGKRSANSFISAKNGELVVLGGLQRQAATESKASPAIIGELPLIGRLFSSRGKGNIKAELMVFIRPTIVRDTSDGRELAEETLDVSDNKDAIDRFLNTGRLDVNYKKPKEKKGEKGSEDSSWDSRERLQKR